MALLAGPLGRRRVPGLRRHRAGLGADRRQRGPSPRGARAAGCPEGEAAYPDDFLTATPERDWIGEVIREKLLERTRDELPFAHAVVVESIRPGEGKDITVVTASIVVEREGQKGILVGKGGAMIRDIGKAAREELEAELGRKLYLELTVRVQPDWRNDERFLTRLEGRRPEVIPSTGDPRSPGEGTRGSLAPPG